MNDWEERIESNILTRQLLKDNEAVLIAVSGGLDSMVLLHLLHELAPTHSWKLHTAHFNHRLRGRSSDADERLVRKTAEKLKLPISVEQGNVAQYAAEKKVSIEMAARELRHAFFAGVAQRHTLRKVAVAHHADDQVELFFLRLQRGAGSDALAGMKWKSPSPADRKLTLIRPLLDQTREALKNYAAKAKIPFREDASNASSEFLRNRIRKEIIPILKQQQPPIFQTVLRSMEIVGAEAEFVAETVETWRREKSVPFSELHIALQRRILHDELRELHLPVDFELIERLRQFPDQPISIGADSAVCRDAAGKIRLKKSSVVGFQEGSRLVQLGRKGHCAFAGLRFEWECTADSRLSRSPDSSNSECFDAAKVGNNIELRHWRPGDRFQPIGLPHSVKLQDWFVNAKVPLEERRKKVVAVAENGEIFWVEGLRISERFKLEAGTLRQLKWHWKSA